MKRSIRHALAFAVALPAAACGGSQPAAEETTPRAEAPPIPDVPREDQPSRPGVAVVAIDLECPDYEVFFETDSAELTPGAQAALDTYASCLKAEPGTDPVMLTGMADPRGSEPYNASLSRRRAENVASYLADQGAADGFHILPLGEAGAVEGVPSLWPAQRRVAIEPR